MTDTTRLEIYSNAPSIRHVIQFDGKSFELSIDGGVWQLYENGSLIAVVGCRGRWQDALRDALVYLSAALKASTAGGGDAPKTWGEWECAQQEKEPRK